MKKLMIVIDYVLHLYIIYTSSHFEHNYDILFTAQSDTKIYYFIALMI